MCSEVHRVTANGAMHVVCREKNIPSVGCTAYKRRRIVERSKRPTVDYLITHTIPGAGFESG